MLLAPRKAKTRKGKPGNIPQYSRTTGDADPLPAMKAVNESMAPPRILNANKAILLFIYQPKSFCTCRSEIRSKACAYLTLFL
ncbi:hypothetical protein ALT785_270111 [Alteromonas infernus]